MKRKLLLLNLILVLILATTGVALAKEGNSLSLLTYEMLSPQSCDCISENLNLLKELEGVSISWQSSDNTVISSEGVVIRPKSEPREVTLTATANGESRDFVFSVAPENYYVYYSESFDYSEFNAKDITKILPDWVTRMNNTSYPSSKFATETLSDESTNCYIRNEMWKDRPQYHLNEIKPSGKVKVSYNVYMDLPDNTYGIFDYNFYFDGDNRARMRFVFNADNTIEVIYIDKSTWKTIGTTSFEKYNLKNRWVQMEYVLDTDNKKMWMYIDGTLVTSAVGINSAYMTGPLRIVDFDLGTTILDAILKIDDMSIVSICESSAEKDVIEVSECLSIENFSSQSKFAVTENLNFSGVRYLKSHGVNIVYEGGSDNLMIEGDIGRIIRDEEDKKAILHATITKDGTDVSRTKTFEFIIKGSKYKVYDSESFYYPDFVGEKTNVEVGGWGLMHEPQNEGALDSMYVEEAGNCSVKSFRFVPDSSYGGNDLNYFCHWFNDTSKSDVTFEARIKTGNVTDAQRKIYVLNLYGKYGKSNTLQSYTQMHFYMSADSTVSMDASRYKVDEGVNGTKTVATNIACPGEWFDFKMVVNMFEKTFSIYINGECMTPEPLNFMKVNGVDINAEATELVYFCANPFRTMSSCELYIDDFASYSEKGVFADTIIYKNGVKTSDLGYLVQGDILSADVQISQFPESCYDEISIIAAVYDEEKLHDVVVGKGSIESGKYSVKFPKLEIPDVIENMNLKIYCMDSAKGIAPICEEMAGKHKLNGSITPLEYKDNDTGRTYHTIDLNGEDAIRSYYTMPIWSSDSKKFYFYDTLYRMYEYNIETQKYRYIDTIYSESLVMTSKLGNLFYVNTNKEIIRITPEGKKEVVGALPKELNIIGATLLQVNNDESFLSLEIFESATDCEFDTSKKKRITIMDMNTGEWELRYIYGFDTVTYVPNHININPNPAYSNLVAFAHEGRGSDCQGNPERIWLLDSETGEIKNLYKQKISYSNVPAEIVSHEAWMQSGEWMMFANKSTVVPGGITFFKPDGSDRRYINNDYSYLHPSGSTITDRFVVSDTSYDGKTTKLVLIDCYTGKSYLLATLPQSAVNPGHTHPNFSFDGTKVIFGVNSEDYSVMRIGWMDISDIIDNVADGEEIILSESCSTTSYSGTDFYLDRKEVGGKDFFCIAKGNHMNVNITSFEKETSDVTITFDYIDSGMDDIVIDYVRWEMVDGKNQIVNYSENIARTNTESVKTAIVTLNGINAENLKIMGADFTIKGEKTELSVKNISIIEN